MPSSDNKEVTIKYQLENGFIDHGAHHNAGPPMPKCAACNRVLRQPYVTVLDIHTVGDELGIRASNPGVYVCVCGCIWSIASLFWAAQEIEGLSLRKATSGKATHAFRRVGGVVDEDDRHVAQVCADIRAGKPRPATDGVLKGHVAGAGCAVGGCATLGARIVSRGCTQRGCVGFFHVAVTDFIRCDICGNGRSLADDG